MPIMFYINFCIFSSTYFVGECFQPGQTTKVCSQRSPGRHITNPYLKHYLISTIRFVTACLQIGCDRGGFKQSETNTPLKLSNDLYVVIILPHDRAISCCRTIFASLDYILAKCKHHSLQNMTQRGTTT